MSDRVVVHAPAKVNLRLRVLAREAAGFHSLESLFCAVSLHDSVVVERAGAGISLEVTGTIDTGPRDRNLAVRAAERFYDGIGETPAVRIELMKRIPSAAGLGGGSSDAAATLRALNHLHGAPVSGETLLRWGAELGSDVPFFLCGSPLALGWSRGERLLELPPLPPRPVLIVHPGVPMATSELFARLSERRGGERPVVGMATSLAAISSWDAVAELARNDFHEVAFELFPPLRDIERHLLAAGAQIALLSGSGSAIFAVFTDEAAREAGEKAVAPLGFSCFRAWTLTRWPPLEGELR